jgi:hypothetical protein
MDRRSAQNDRRAVGEPIRALLQRRFENEPTLWIDRPDPWRSLLHALKWPWPVLAFGGFIFFPCFVALLIGNGGFGDMGRPEPSPFWVWGIVALMAGAFLLCALSPVFAFSSAKSKVFAATAQVLIETDIGRNDRATIKTRSWSDLKSVRRRQAVDGTGTLSLVFTKVEKDVQTDVMVDLVGIGDVAQTESIMKHISVRHREAGSRGE